MPYKDYQKHLDQCRKYYKEHKEEARLRYNPEKHKANNRKHHLTRKYGISVDEYKILFEKQTGRCAVCGKHQSEFTVALCVDHDHESGSIRGLLCNKCNQAIGLMDDNIEIMKTAIIYLEANE